MQTREIIPDQQNEQLTFNQKFKKSINLWLDQEKVRGDSKSEIKK